MSLDKCGNLSKCITMFRLIVSSRVSLRPRWERYFEYVRNAVTSLRSLLEEFIFTFVINQFVVGMYSAHLDSCSGSTIRTSSTIGISP